jgi:GH15 family glucan-1,4-alpha-glucosidase
MSISSNDRLALAQHSVAVIKANQAPTGAYLASPNFRVYRYSWLRDGAFIADAMSRAGHASSAEAFFGWCTRILTARGSKVESLIERHRAGQQIQPDEYLHARYTVDGEEAREDWWNFQLDGYGTWLWALGEHISRNPGSTRAPYREGILLSVKYLTEFWREPSYDWWEEHPGHRHTSTLAPIYAALRDASGWDEMPQGLRRLAAESAREIREMVLADGQREGRFAKWLGGDAVDASLISCSVPFRLVTPNDSLMSATVAQIESNLANGGVHRYLADTYYGGGEWPLLSALLGWYFVTIGRRTDAQGQLDWIVRHASRDGDLPEQVSDRLLAPSSRQAWIDRWGPVATPLLWSHAMYLTLALELGAVTSPVLGQE